MFPKIIEETFDEIKEPLEEKDYENIIENRKYLKNIH